MSNLVNKLPYVDHNVAKKIAQLQNASVKKFKTYARSCTITPEMIAFTVDIHYGNGFKSVFITEDMVGHKLGEFAPTRTFRGHRAADKKAAKGKK